MSGAQASDDLGAHKMRACVLMRRHASAMRHVDVLSDCDGEALKIAAIGFNRNTFSMKATAKANGFK